MKIKRKAYISLEVVFLLTIMVISGMYVTIKLFNKGHNVSGQEAEAFSKVNHTVNNAINVGSSGGGGSGGGGGGSTPSEPTGVIDTIYWGIDASGKLIISDVQVATALEGKSGSFAGTDTFDFDSAPPWASLSNDIISIKVERLNRRVAPASTAMWFAELNNVTDIDVTNLDTSNVTSMLGMFGFCGTNATALTIGGLNTWDTSKVTSMEMMFFGAGHINEIDLSNWDASNATNMSGMFVGINSLQTIKTPKNIPSTVDVTEITSKPFYDLTDYNREYVAGSFPVGNGDVSHTLSASYPYAAKVASVQKLYDVGEAALTEADIIPVNGVDCYVLKVDGDKAELITKDIYNVRFDTGGHTSEDVEGHVGAGSYADKTYDYKYSTLRTWMNNFYVNGLGSDPHILQTTVTYYTKDSFSSDFSTYTQGTVDDYVFAIDAIEAKTNSSKFIWNNSNKQITITGSSTNITAQAFWSTAGYHNSGYVNCPAWDIFSDGTFSSSNVIDVYGGARPVFWISLE